MSLAEAVQALESPPPAGWCPQTMRETDWVLPLEKLQPYLYWIRKQFDSALDDQEIAAIAQIAHQLPVGEGTEYSSRVIFDNYPLTLKLSLFLTEQGTLILGLCTDPKLSEQLDWTIERFYDHIA